MRIPLYAKILIGMVIGLCWGLISIYFVIDPKITLNYIKPFGTLFVNLLKMISIPMVLASLVIGVASLNDVKKLSRIGGKTLAIYVLTTFCAISVGLVIANIMNPGNKIPEDTKAALMHSYQQNIQNKITAAEQDQNSVLDPLVDIVPENIFAALTSNTAMLQVVFFALLLGIALVKSKTSAPVISFFEGLNDAILKIVDMIMWFAPVGVLALIATLLVETAGNNLSEAFSLLKGLLWYSMTVIFGLLVILFIIYPIVLKTFTKVNLIHFFKSARPVHLLAFSTSSSNATLPLTIKQSEEALGVPKQIAGFVLPLGATVNMDGTSLYQGVAAVFIAQATGIDLSLTEQLVILLTATLASIGSAGVPGSGLLMLVIVLQSVGIPLEGLALILAVDRILDMCRTVINVTGDMVVAQLITHSEKKPEFPIDTPEKAIYHITEN